MGYRITLVMQKEFKNNSSFQGGIVPFAKQVKELISDVLCPNGERIYESYDEAANYASLRTYDFYEVHFYQDALEVSTSENWSMLMDWDNPRECPTIQVFQKIIERLHPQNTWLGNDYATIQGPSLEYGVDTWLQRLKEEDGEMEPFCYSLLKKKLNAGENPGRMYYVRDNNLMKE